MSQLFTFDFTLFDDVEHTKICKTLEEHCKKWTFQKEKGNKTGKIHFQGRFSLKNKRQEHKTIELFKLYWTKFHLSPTSNENKNNNFYVIKDDTRIDGPWTNEDYIELPRDIIEITKLRPWQQAMIKVLDKHENRIVDCIIDPKGNNGKGIFWRYMMCTDKTTFNIPMINDYKDMMQMCMCVGPKRVYFIDMPRAINKEKLFQLYSAIETLKGGYMFDTRYDFKYKLFDPPRILVFTNEQPDVTLLSYDRWKFWTISPSSQELENWIPDDIPNDQLEFLKDDQ